MNTVHVVGLGAGDLGQLPYKAVETLKNTPKLFLRTEHHPVIKDLKDMGIQYQTFDHIYEKYGDFQNVYREIVDTLCEEVTHHDVTYAVPGHPMVAEQTTIWLLEKEAEGVCKVIIHSGSSFLDEMFTSLKIDPIDGFTFLDATGFIPEQVQVKNHLIFCQVYDGRVASEIKLTLLDILPYDYPVTIISAAGSSEEVMYQVPLCEMDHDLDVDNLRSVYIPPVKNNMQALQEFQSLKEVIKKLRSPEGCPWDREQTHQSLKKFLIEETYEFLEAVDMDDDFQMEEEIGDVLLQVMLHAEIADEEGRFSIEDVIRTLNEKLIRRHPHVFTGQTVENADEVVQVWDEIKKQEKETVDPFAKVGKGMPAVLQALELQKAAAKIGLEFECIDQIYEKVSEELQEFKDEKEQGNLIALNKELGDLLFSVINVARYTKLNPEEALLTTNVKFKNRLAWIYDKLEEEGKEPTNLSLAELDEYWNQSKLWIE